MRHLKTFEQSLYDKFKGKIKDTLKKGGMYYITNSEKFENLTKLKDKQQAKLDAEIKKYGEAHTIGGEAAKQMVDMYNQNVSLLEKTIDQYLSKKLTKEGVEKILVTKIKEISSTPTGFLIDATKFKESAIDLLKWLKSDVTVWLI